MDKDQSDHKRKRLFIALIVVVALLVLTLLFLFTPLKVIFYSPQSAPAISLEIVEGPVLDEDTGLYCIVVEAVVFGKPEPKVIFNRNDGFEETEKNLSLILLEEGASFLLKATASNSLGSAEASLEITAGEAGADEEAKAEDSAEVPTIILSIDAGPLYSSDDDVCYYHIKATVTGSPLPKIEWSRDDSAGGLGSDMARVNLHDPSETYSLTATASNSEGTVTATINLAWGCNRPPVISQIILMGTYYTGLEYGVSAAATDPDGDTLSYNWSVDGGSIDNPGGSSIKWTMPDAPGLYTITVVVDDGKGGRAEKKETVNVLPTSVASLLQVHGGGIIVRDEYALKDTRVRIGDSLHNKPVRGFLSFDLWGVAGKVIVSAEIKFNNYAITNDPYDIIEKIWVESVYWGTGYIEQADYDIPGVMLGEYDMPTFICSGDTLVDELNRALRDGRTVFQIRLRHKGYQTNNNNSWDTIWYGGIYPVEFTVSYLP